MRGGGVRISLPAWSRGLKMFACCSRCSSSLLLRRLRDSSLCFVSAFSFLEYLPQPWFITRRTWWATLQNQTRKGKKKRWCLFTDGEKKNRNLTSCECKIRCTAVVTVAVCGHQVSEVVFLSFLFATYFVLYWSMTSALHVCNKCCSVLYLCLACVLLWVLELMVYTSPNHVFRILLRWALWVVSNHCIFTSAPEHTVVCNAVSSQSAESAVC